MDFQDILKIQQLVNKVNKVQGKSLLVTEIGTDYIEVSPTEKETLYESYISNIIKYVEAIEGNWFITTDEFGLRLHCF